MDRRDEIKDFLASRRARINPEEAGVPTFPGLRRVPGLRREEVAQLAGVSVGYYTRIERGKITGASIEVLDAVARALRLDDVERQHLVDLVTVRPVRATGGRRTPRRKIPAGIQAVLDSIATPAFVQNAHLEMVAANTLGRALYSIPIDALPYSHILHNFLNPDAPDFFRDWDLVKRNGVALLRAEAGRDPENEALISLVGRLSTQSAEFRQLWAAHDVLRYRGGEKRFTHSEVGDLDFGFEAFAVASAPELIMHVYTFEPNSATAKRLALLGSWSSSPLTT
jgi:hypothetical protein